MSSSERVLPTLQPGETLAGTLRIEALLGAGGAGAVYRARDERSGRKLALKQLRPPDGEHRALLVSLFEREFHTLSQLAHPRIIEVYDYGVEQGFPYYTMELLDGEDLYERGKLPWREACALLCDVASSLAILHSRGLIHRDVSARNVRCTRDGRAKLIDFGAMAPIGVSQRVVGTPPFVPPEALQLQALDGRADLYGLGALAYWTLTGRHAYPAKTLNQLREVWRRPAPTPAQHEPDLPPALSELVMSLLRLERGERPSTAAEVMERLSGLAGLPLQELPQVSRAYLIMPTLVGRADVLAVASEKLLQASSSKRGGSLWIEGAAGVGRSRLLDACVLQAKLMGATVLRGTGVDGAQGDYGLARSLCAQLFQALPELCEQSAQLRVGVLAYVLPELAPRSRRSSAVPDRRQLQTALRDWLLSIARTKHIVLAVDDLSSVDEPSAAWLGALAHGAKRRRLNLLLTARADAPASPALNVLHELSHGVALEPLSQAQTEALLRALFGESARVLPLAPRMHALSAGNPRQIMALAEHLVERGSARYEAGSWSLPLELSSDDLPASVMALWSSRIAALSPDARELADALCLTDPRAMSVGDYAALSAHRSQARVLRALQELSAAGVLVPEGARYRFSQRDLIERLEAELPEARKRELHARIAVAIADNEDPTLLPRHLLLGGREREGIEDLLSKRNEPRLTYSSHALSLLEDAVRSARTLDLPSELLLELEIWLVAVATFLGDQPRFNQTAWPLLERLTRDSGLADYLELQQDPSVPAEARLATALERTERRYRALPDPARGCEPGVARERLGLLGGVIAGFASSAMELWPLERMPSLLPLVPVHPAAGIVQMHLDIARAMICSRFDVAARKIDELLRLLEPAPAYLYPTYCKQLRLGCLYMSGLLLAGRAHASTRERLKELEAEPGYRALAWRAYTVCEMMLGDAEAARDCQRRADLLDLQDGGFAIFPGGTMDIELSIHGVAGDLIGVKRSMERLAVLATRLPGWSPYFEVARAHYHRLQGDPEAGLAAVEQALQHVAPGRSPAWGTTITCHLQLLLALRPGQPLLDQALAYMEAAAQQQLGGACMTLQRWLAEALVQVGRAGEAQRLADEHLALQHSLGTRGLMLGLAHETRARVAIALLDAAGFAQHAELCSREYRIGSNANLKSRHERLLREAIEAGMQVEGAPQPRPASEDAPLQDAARTVYSRMLMCLSPGERAQQALQLLLEATGAETGYFFGLRSGKLRWLSSSEQAEPADAMKRMLEDCLKREFDDIASAKPGRSDRPGRAVAPQLGRFTDELGRSFEPLLLSGTSHGELIIAGAAALHYPEDERPAARQAMLDAVIEALITDDVVDPITCVT